MAAEGPEVEDDGVGCNGGAGLAGNLKLHFSPHTSAIVLFSFPREAPELSSGSGP